MKTALTNLEYFLPLLERLVAKRASAKNRNVLCTETVNILNHNLNGSESNSYWLDIALNLVLYFHKPTKWLQYLIRSGR